MFCKRLVLSVLALIFLCTATIAGAQESRPYNLTPYLGYHFFDGKRDYKDRPEFGLLMERMLKKEIGLEAGIGGILTDKESDGDSAFGLAYRLNGNYYPSQLKALDGKLVPYVTAGLGGDYINNKGILGLDGGIGIKYLINKEMAFRAEVREAFLFGGKEDFIVTLGLSFPFGFGKAAPADSDSDGVIDDLDKCPGTPKGVKVDRDGCPLDTDGDGVADYLDKCPNTPKGDKVDTKGCSLAKDNDSDGDGVIDTLNKCPGTPKGVKVDKDGCPLDTDGDGVADYLDKCPDTPKGVKVDKDGCPLDTDGDGVADYLDKCPDTPRGVKVDKDGCPLDTDGDSIPDYSDKCPGTPKGIKVDVAGCPLDADGDGVPDYLDQCPNSPKGSKVDKIGCVTSVTLKVNFDTSKSIVKEEYYGEIERFAVFMKEYPSVKVEIQGHTDNIGRKKANLKLSDERANAVMRVLVDKFNIPQNRVSAMGYGMTVPVESNETDEGKAKNRRVEAVVVK